MCEFKSPMTNYAILNLALPLMSMKIYEIRYRNKNAA